MHIGESSGNAYLVNHQCCYEVNTVIEATVIEAKEQEIQQKKEKKMVSMRMHTTEHFPGDVLLQVLAFL